jgi:hypothetical protein
MFHPIPRPIRVIRAIRGSEVCRFIASAPTDQVEQV